MTRARRSALHAPTVLALLLGFWAASAAAASGGGPATDPPRPAAAWETATGVVVTPDAPKDFLFFGKHVALKGDTLLVGVPRMDERDGLAPGAYVFRWSATDDAWIQEARLRNPQDPALDFDGATVFLADETLALVAAPGSFVRRRGDAYLGQILVYEREEDGQWKYKGHLPNPSVAPELPTGFGRALGASPDWVVVGAPLESPHDHVFGALQVYRRSGRIGLRHEATLALASPDPGDRFGSSAAAGDGWVAGGAPFAAGGGDHRGTVAVFGRGDHGWESPVVLAGSDTVDWDRFGFALAGDGDTLLVGAPGADGIGLERGAVYVFVRGTDGTWTEEAILTASDGADGDLFGERVALDGDTAVVSSRFHDGFGTAQGAAWVFVRSEGVWSEAARLTPADAQDFDYFGDAVSVSGDRAAVGLGSRGLAGSGQGSVIVFDAGEAAPVATGARDTLPHAGLPAADTAPAQVAAGSILRVSVARAPQAFGTDAPWRAVHGSTPEEAARLDPETPPPGMLFLYR